MSSRPLLHYLKVKYHHTQTHGPSVCWFLKKHRPTLQVISTNSAQWIYMHLMRTQPQSALDASAWFLNLLSPLFRHSL